MNDAIDLTRFSKHLPELEALWQQKDDATLSYSAGIDAVSNATGVNKGALRKLVTARKKGVTEEAREQAQELADLIAVHGG